MSTPTSNPVPSTDPKDLLFNAEKLDEVVNSSALAYVDRLGVSRDTAAGAIYKIAGITNRGAWAAATAYATKDIVLQAGVWYVCVVAHTSAAAFATDEATKWRVYQGVVGSDLSASTGASLVGYSKDGAFSDGTVGAAVHEAFKLARRGPRFHPFGGQLRSLRDSLSNPLEQFTGIVLIGDSITWGRTLPENAVTDPRDGTLSDPRDNFTAPSWANELKRYIGSQYARGAAPTLSNWAASAAGQAIAEYSVTNMLYPRETPFTLTTFGASITNTEVDTSLSPTGFQYRLADGNTAGTSWQKISFPFTGDTFTLVFGCVEVDKIDYELIVDGVSQGLFSTGTGAGIVEGNNQRRLHTFGYVRNKTVELKTNRAAFATGTRIFRLEGIEVTKKIRITNQGISGASTRTYDLYNLSGSFSVPTAVTAKDNYVLVQLGTNDRIIDAAVPKGVQGFQRHLKAILDRLTPLASVIVMCAGPAENESTVTYSFSMQETRATLLREAKTRVMDFIDNYAPCEGLAFTSWTADGLHPNKVGHALIAGNLVGALESA